MTFKEVSYNYNDIAQTLFKKGKRIKDDPVKQFKNIHSKNHSLFLPAPGTVTLQFSLHFGYYDTNLFYNEHSGKSTISQK